MSWIPDSTSIAALSVPGTHDTMALAPKIVVDLWTQTQSLSLLSQLNAGIRALDIRCRHFQNSFTIHHEAVYLNANFDDVLRTATQFLRDHPRETLLIRVQEEYEPEGNTRSFEETFASYQNQPAYKDYFWKGTSVPSLGEARGKIIILDKFKKENWTYGIPWNQGYPVDFQDSWTVDTVYNIVDKWHKVQAQLEKTNTGALSTLYVNFLSGSGWGAPPNKVAGGEGALSIRGVNDYALGYLVGAQVQRVGVMMMDYPGAGLMDAIIALNYRLGPTSASLPGDFDTIFKNISYSIGGDAEARWRGVNTFVYNIAPGRSWHVMALKSAWGGWLSTDGNYASSDTMDGYTHVAFTSRTVTSAVSKSHLSSFVQGQLSALSGDAAQRAVQLHGRVSARFPFQLWTVLVKQAPGGYSNWSYSDYGTGDKVSLGDYTYAVQGYSAADGVYLYEHSGYEGRVLHLTSSVEALGSAGFDDILSSVRIIGPYQVELCEHPSRTGRCVRTAQSVTDIQSLLGGPWNDQISYAGIDWADFH
ncbi:phosphatidylinositol-specific phospholipase C domain-containing protein [Stigmatella sp. ncwal1]|uniref:1-phosphatidylinositol phosphodiesterase n=1 Tax=Stigmatella ashevillensis TaxID=2995309 RepID=A0ABT5D4L4_9BACT|nr:phosphatidylinositol-specific phospholipase C domain-containing protein [Stigmatella ashevillena]MDC0708612.1 phosphatidylinositol-specific phospholipase C domain-containing protein [Stigmatella ashevillena]